MKKSTVLLVEDNPDDIALIQRAFRKANLPHSLHLAGDGDEAVRMLSTYLGGECPSLVLLDLKLPRRSGLEVLDWLRNQGSLRRIPVVVLTSSRESKDINRAYDLGANSYLVKPVQFEDLMLLVTSLDLYWFTLNERPAIQNDGSE